MPCPENKKNCKGCIQVTHGMSGYFAVMLTPDEDGFCDPWTTGVGRYKTSAEAKSEAKSWAASEGLVTLFTE